MTSQIDSQLVEKFRAWCSDEKLDPNHAFVLSDLPTDTDVDDIEETAQTVKAFGRVRVRSIQTDTQTGSNNVLCECREVVKPDRIPPSLLPSTKGSSWKVFLFVQPENPVEDFVTKLNKLMSDEGKTAKDIQDMLSSGASQSSSAESIIRAVGDLLGKTMKTTNENNAFRRLRTFSGNFPTPAGEENLDHWLEQARLMIDECDCSEREKRKRIVESLKGPALEIIQAVRINDPDASPECYVEAIESAFGTPVSGEDLYFIFRSLHQQSGEKLSDFLRRLERSLTKVVQKGGLPSYRADRARIDQLIRGAVDSDMMLVHLRLRERKEKPPTFLKLLNEIREEEEYEAGRRKLNTTVRQVKVKEDSCTKTTDVKELKAEIQELRTELSELLRRPLDSHAEPTVTPTKKPADSDSEVQILRKQVQQLQNQLTVMSVSHSQMKADPQKRNERPRSNPSSKPQHMKDSDRYFCYRCGENGHIATHCAAPENSAKVIQKLLSALRKTKDDKVTSRGSDEAKEVGSVRNGSVYSQRPQSLPE